MSPDAAAILARTLPREVAEELALSLGGTGILSDRVRGYATQEVLSNPVARRKLAHAILAELDRIEAL